MCTQQQATFTLYLQAERVETVTTLHPGTVQLEPKFMCNTGDKYARWSAESGHKPLPCLSVLGQDLP